MPATVPLNQFFIYLRKSAEAAARSWRGSAPDQGGGGLPPGARFVTYLGQRVTYAAAPVYTRGY